MTVHDEVMTVVDQTSTEETDATPHIRFTSGLPGFPGAHTFTLDPLDDDGTVFALRNVEDPGLRFIVVPPDTFFPDYSPEIDDATVAELELSSVDDVLVLETMHFGDEVRSPADLDVPGKVKLTDRELKIADQLIESLTTDFDPAAYTDTYRDRVADLVRRKAEGGDVVVDEATDEPEEVTDLMAALESSLDDARQSRKTRQQRRELEGLSVGELKKRATKAKIDGRSQMSKTELITALAEAS